MASYGSKYQNIHNELVYRIQHVRKANPFCPHNRNTSLSQYPYQMKEFLSNMPRALDIYHSSSFKGQGTKDNSVNPLQGGVSVYKDRRIIKTPCIAFVQQIFSNMEDEQTQELQLLPPSPSLTQVSFKTFLPSATPPELDLSLSMSIGQSQPSPNSDEAESNMRSIQALKQHNAEQIQLAAVEKAYVERVRELTRREIELAEKGFSRARMIWKQAQDDMENVERMKVASTRRINSACIEITCQACRQLFQP